MDRLGRIVMRSAIEAGIDVVAVNDPFVPVHQMAALAKFEAVKSPWQPKRIDLRVSTGPEGQFYVDGKVSV